MFLFYANLHSPKQQKRPQNHIICSEDLRVMPLMRTNGTSRFSTEGILISVFAVTQKVKNISLLIF